MHFALTDFARKTKLSAIVLSSDWNLGDLNNLMKTVRELQGNMQQVIVVGPVPVYYFTLPRLLATGMIAHDSDRAARGRTQDSARIDARFADVLSKAGIEYISLYQMMCSSGKCATLTSNDVPIQFDTNHFTEDGSKWIGAKIKKQALITANHQYADSTIR